MGKAWSQFFPPPPTLTEKNLPSLAGKVFVVTGGNAGVGLALVKILYSKGGAVYIAGRSSSRIASAIESIKSNDTSNNSGGRLESLIIDLSDLDTIKGAVDTFLSRESRLDVLFNNAGIAHVPAGSISAQGHEAHIATNVLGHYLLTKLLLPVLLHTARSSPQRGSVRVVFTSSSIIDMTGPPGGLSLSELTPGNHSQDKARNYSASKAGNWFLSAEFNKRYCNEGILCVTQNPGNLKTKSWNGIPIAKFLLSPFLYDAKMGAYTELWAGLSGEVKLEDGGRFVEPWGRWHPSPRKDVLESLKTREEGGTGLAADFWNWCEKETKAYGGDVAV